MGTALKHTSRSTLGKKLKVIPRSFFDSPTTKLAQRLLGCYLRHSSEQGECLGRIVETEAYLYRNDPACHASRGRTSRNEAMFGRAGICYIYQIYGMHYCFNVVSGRCDEGEAVLIRALEPQEGIPLMEERRHSTDIYNLCSGPAKLVQALGIEKKENGSCLRKGPIRLLYEPQELDQSRSPSRSSKIVRTTRVGISSGVELPLRFYIADNPFISKP